MALSTIISLTGAGAATQIPGDHSLLGFVESNAPEKPRKLFCCSGWNAFHSHLPTHSCCWRVPNAASFNFKTRNSLLPLAQGKDSQDRFLSSLSEDTDDMYEELFKKHGKVVFRSGDQKSPSGEVEDDAESLSFAMSMAKVASEVKAADIKVLFVKPLVYWTRFFIIATAFSRPQIDAIGSKIRDLAEKKYGRIPSGDSKPNSWTLLDFGDVVVHIFLPQQRAFYNLEEFYGNATPIELPLENQPPFRG